MPSHNKRFRASGGVTARKFGGERKFCTFVARPAAPHLRQAARRYVKAGGSAANKDVK